MKESMVSPAIAKAVEKNGQDVAKVGTAKNMSVSSLADFQSQLETLIGTMENGSVVAIHYHPASAYAPFQNQDYYGNVYRNNANSFTVMLRYREHVISGGKQGSSWAWKTLAISEEASGKTLGLLLTKNNPVHVHFSTYSFGGHIIAGVSDTEFVEVLYANGYAYINNHGSGQITCQFDKTTYTDFTFSTTAANNGFVSVYVPAHVEVTFSRT